MNELGSYCRGTGIEEQFISYSIGRSWATSEKYMGIPTEIISKGLGHKSQKTSEIYPKSYQKILDEASARIVQ
jgi:integrase